MEGEQQPSGLSICTDSFSISEVVILINVLIIRSDLNCHIRWKTTPSELRVARIYIPSKEMDKLRSIVYSHIVPSVRYKIIPSYIKKRV